MKTTTYKYSKIKYAALLPLTVLVTFLGVYFILYESKVLAGGIIIIFCGYASFILLRAALDTKAQLTLDHDGIEDRHLGVGKINWNDVKSISIKKIEKDDNILLEVSKEKYEYYVSRTKGLHKFMLSKSTFIDKHYLTIDLANIKTPTEEIKTSIVKYYKNNLI